MAPSLEVTVYGPLRSATGEKTVALEGDVETVADALAALVDAHPRARAHIYADDGTVRSSVRVAVDGERVGLDDPCPDGASIALHPAVQGG